MMRVAVAVTRARGSNEAGGGARAIAFFLACVALGGCERSFVARGRVVNQAGAAVAGAKITANVRSTRTDANGCFALAEKTYWRRHAIGFSIAAEGYPTLTGSLPAPGRLRVRVILATPPVEDPVAYDLPAGELGPCEPR
jgi:hypothetical protein